MKPVWKIEYCIYCISIAPHPNHSSVTSCEGGEGREWALCSALICAFKLVSHRQGNTVWVPLCRQGPPGTGHTSHGFKSPQHPSFGEDANGGGAQWLQQPGFTPCVRGACGQLIKQLPPPECQDCRKGMEGTKHIVPAVQDADSPAWRNPVVF